jgi:hypothetical protein
VMMLRSSWSTKSKLVRSLRPETLKRRIMDGMVAERLFGSLAGGHKGPDCLTVVFAVQLYSCIAVQLPPSHPAFLICQSK